MIGRRLRRLVRRAWPGARDRPVVLMYHRVASPPVDPWELCVRPERFEAQIEALVRTRKVVPLEALAADDGSGAPLAAVTFDDGYLDNLEAALPVLRRHACPASVFVTTGMTGRLDPFWWDALATLILESRSLPAVIAVPTGQGDSLPIDSAGPREATHRAVWAALRPLPDASRTTALQAIRRQIDAPAPYRCDERAMMPNELRQLTSDGLVTIGAHSVTHPSLIALPRQERSREMSESRAALERLLDRPVTSLAYPYGDYDEETKRAAEEAGFALAVTTERRAVPAHCDPREIPRLNIGDWTAERLLQTIEAA